MTHPPRASGRDRRSLASLAGLCAGATCLLGCGSEPPAGIWDGGFGTGACTPGTTGQFTCTPDPGSWPADCAGEEEGLELANLGDFSGTNPAFVSGGVPSALNWYVYVDRSGDGRITSFTRSWEAPLAPDPFPRCGSDTTPMAIHIQGGPFYGWGGGFGTSAKDWLGGSTLPDHAFDCGSATGGSLCPRYDLPDYLQGKMVDASGYEGIAVWARRGPDSQGGLRVNVGDWDTDDDISYLTYNADPTLPRNCERVRECGCTNHKPCQAWDEGPLDYANDPALAATHPNLASWGRSTDASASSTCAYPSAASSSKPAFYCESPDADVVPGTWTTAATETRCNACNTTRCNEPYEAYPNGAPVGNSGVLDAAFFGKPCTAHTQRSGLSASFCFDPAKDPVPAEADQQCGDHWMRGIYLSNDWRLYLVPFTQMQQQGFGKRFGKMDPSRVTMVRLTWDGGYVDFWIGKVAFYRHKR